MKTNTRRIVVTYFEEQWSDTCEKTTTHILVSGMPLLHTNTTDLTDLNKDPDTYGSNKRTLDAIKSLLVPQGQEVCLKAFSNNPHNHTQGFTFTTLCDHGD